MIDRGLGRAAPIYAARLGTKERKEAAAAALAALEAEKQRTEGGINAAARALEQMSMGGAAKEAAAAGAAGAAGAARSKVPEGAKTATLRAPGSGRSGGLGLPHAGAGSGAGAPPPPSRAFGGSGPGTSSAAADAPARPILFSPPPFPEQAVMALLPPSWVEPGWPWPTPEESTHGAVRHLLLVTEAKWLETVVGLPSSDKRIVSLRSEAGDLEEEISNKCDTARAAAHAERILRHLRSGGTGPISVSDLEVGRGAPLSLLLDPPSPRLSALFPMSSPAPR